MRVIGKTAEPVAMVFLNMRTVMYTLEIGKTTRLMDLVHTSIVTRLVIQANERMTCRMDLELKVGRMEASMKGFIKMERNKGLGITYGVIYQVIGDSDWIIKSMGKESTGGQMDAVILENDSLILCMD